MSISGITAASLGAAPPITSAEPDSETQRAFEQDKKADVRVDWESDSRLYLRHPHNTSYSSEEALFAAIERATSARNLAVVDMGKPMGMLSRRDFKQRVDMIEARLKKLGFKRIAFHLASASEHPIYRE